MSNVLEFKINEIKQGRSAESIVASASEVNLEEEGLVKCGIELVWDRKQDRIKLDMDISALFEFVCDRSLESYDSTINTKYSILFDNSIDNEEDEQSMALRRLELAKNKLSIAKEVRDSLLLEIPIKKLHPKFITDAGEPTPFEKVFFQESEVDDRWEVLKSLKNNDK